MLAQHWHCWGVSTSCHPFVRNYTKQPCLEFFYVLFYLSLNFTRCTIFVCFITIFMIYLFSIFEIKSYMAVRPWVSQSEEQSLLCFYLNIFFKQCPFIYGYQSLPSCFVISDNFHVVQTWPLLLFISYSDPKTTLYWRLSSVPGNARAASTSLRARFMGPTWGPSGADRTQVGPMLAPWTLLSGMIPACMTWLRFQNSAYTWHNMLLNDIDKKKLVILSKRMLPHWSTYVCGATVLCYWLSVYRHDMILNRIRKKECQNFLFVQIMNSEKTPHTSPLRGSYGASFLNSMMTSSNGNIFRLTGHLCGEFTGHRWIPRTKVRDAELWCFLWSAPQ